jgi:16S rRNA A1518/A1519 N6-dimethyltransferase RsmA/KsgA/DIM1 with predicted DNA glycosylase/AP lyase activity
MKRYSFFSNGCNLGKIVSVGSPPSAETAVIEIGPAAGNLTRALLGRGYDKILLIEKDLRFKPILEVNFLLSNLH